MKRCIYICLITITTFALTISSLAKASAPAEWFFSQPDILTAKISPDGQNIAVIRLVNNIQQIILTKPENDYKAVLLNTKKYTKKESSVNQLVWIDNRYLAVQFSEERKGIKDLVNTKVSRRLLIIDTNAEDNALNKVLSVRTRGWLANPLRHENGYFLYAKSGPYSKIYKINIALLQPDKKTLGKLDKVDGGQFKKSNEIKSIQGYAIRWIFDNNHEIKSVINWDSKENISLTEFSKNQENKKFTIWKNEKNKSKKERKKSEEKNRKMLIPIAIASDKHTYYCFDYNEDDIRSIYKIDLGTKSEKLVYETSSYKITDLILSDKNEFLGVTVLNNGTLEYEYIDKKIKLKNPSKIVSVISQSLDEKKSLTYTEDHNNAGEIKYHNQISKKTMTIGHIRPQLEKKLHTKQIEDTIDIDGLNIPYILNIPANSKNKTYPLIVMPHGGPISIYDDRYFDSSTQYFTSNGYAVLRVNFRGSGGHSVSLRQAGKRQWSSGMLLDIYQTTKLVALREDIDSKNICSIGFSYGGYAATMLLIKHPELFKCGANISGISDLHLYVRSPLATTKQRLWLAEYVGDPETEKEDLYKNSPIYIAKNLKRPIFISHGRKDTVVDIEHAYRLKHMLEKHKKPFSFYIDEESGHNFSKPKNTILLFKKILSFVSEHTD